MNIQARRRSIFEQLLRVEDDKLLQAVQNILDFGLEKSSSENKDFSEDLTPYQKNRILKSIQELDAGQGIPHEKVMDEFRAKYKK